MKKIIKTITLITLMTSTFSSLALADQGFVAVGPKISTQGLGIEARTPITDQFYARLGAHYFTYAYNKDKTDDINFKAKLTLMSIPVMLDWHPFEESGFRLSAGLGYNGNKIKATGSAKRGARINGVSYTAAEIGSVSAEVKLGNSMGGLVTIGYDSSFINNGPLSFNMEAGVMYTGTAKLTVSSTGIGGRLVKEAIQKDANDQFNDAKKYLKFFPVLSVGVKYCF